MNLLTLRARSTRVRRILLGFALVFSLIATSAVLAPAFAVPSYPSWAEVQAAKKKVSAKKAMIARLDLIIADHNGMVVIPRDYIQSVWKHIQAQT